MENPIAKTKKFEDAKKIAWEMFKKKEIEAIRIMDKKSYTEKNYSNISYFPDIKKEYGNEKIFENDLFKFTTYSFPGIEFELYKKSLHFKGDFYTVLIVLYFV